MPPGVDYCDGASLGAYSRARSQGDLCHPGTPHWVPGRACPPGTYATTLEMRRNGSVPGPYGGFAGLYPRLHHAGGSQPMLPDVWAAPCPVHGAGGTYGHRHPVHQIYDMPLFVAEHDGAAMADGGVPMSPFYHELDAPTSGAEDIPTPPPRPDGPSVPPSGGNDPNSAPFSRI